MRGIYKNQVQNQLQKKRRQEEMKPSISHWNAKEPALLEPDEYRKE